MLKQTIFGADNEFNHLIGIGFGFGVGRAWPDALSQSLAQNDSGYDPITRCYFAPFWGGLVVAGCVIYYMLRSHMGS